MNLVLVFIFVSLNIFGTAFRKLGFPPKYSLYFLFLSLLSGYVNFPIKNISPRVPMMSGNVSEVLWSGYAASSLKAKCCIIAVNLGGAVIPVVMSVFLSTLVSIIDMLIGSSTMLISPKSLVASIK
ncbi:hypothetical protein METP1_01770 [Methanosarcinales archaeon]|nr:hypothetical protein METP1_01770 [Methanosarcinales archaeon]